MRRSWPTGPLHFGNQDHRHCGLLRAGRERPRRRAADKRDEVAAFQLIELHSFPPAKGHVTGYRIASDQSAGMLEFCNHSWFCLRWRATATRIQAGLAFSVEGV